MPVYIDYVLVVTGISMRQYLDLIRTVLEQGEMREDRTGTGTISLFGMQAKYDLREGFPLLTTKKVLFSSVLRELLWFLRGSNEPTQTINSPRGFEGGLCSSGFSSTGQVSTAVSVGSVPKSDQS